MIGPNEKRYPWLTQTDSVCALQLSRLSQIVGRDVTTAALSGGLHGNASCCSDASPGSGSWWVGVTRHVSPPPLLSLRPLSPVSVGGPRAEASERNTTPRGRREARGGGESRSEWRECEWRTEKKSVKKESFVSIVRFCQRSNKATRRRNVRRQRRCGWAGVNSGQLLAELVRGESETTASGRLQLEQI